MSQSYPDAHLDSRMMRWGEEKVILNWRPLLKDRFSNKQVLLSLHFSIFTLAVGEAMEEDVLPPLTVSLRSLLQQEALPFVPLPLQELLDAGGHRGQRLPDATGP